MAHLVTSHQGEDHISSANHAHENAGQIGNGQYAFKGRGNFALSMPNPNTLRIMSGDAQCNGYHWEIPGDYEEVTIENGTPGKKRIDLVVADIITAPKPDCKLLVIKGEEVNDNAGEPVMPSHIEGDLNDGDTHVQMPICSVKLNGTNHDEPVMLMNVLMPYAEFRDSQSLRLIGSTTNQSFTSLGEVEAHSLFLIALRTSGVTFSAYTIVPRFICEANGTVDVMDSNYSGQVRITGDNIEARSSNSDFCRVFVYAMM